MKPGQYSIQLTGLKEGSHLYEFEIDNDFFTGFEGSEISAGEIKVLVKLVKRSSHMELQLDLMGSVEVLCDRCLEPYMQELDTRGRLLIKLGDHWEEVDDEVLIIPYNESHLDLSQLIYEFANLGLPIQRLHPDDEEGNSSCDPDMLDRIEGFADYAEDEEGEIDPRWKELGKLKEDLLN